MIARPVTNKHDFYARFAKGEFGNKLRSWATVEEIAPYAGTVTMRHMTPGSTRSKYLVPVERIRHEAEEPLSAYRFNESAPDATLLIQGEVLYTTHGWHVEWSTTKTTMRAALQAGMRVSRGIMARELLRHYCCPSSFADIEVLVERYPDHVIEFGVYACELGEVPHRNTIIWEVRRY